MDKTNVEKQREQTIKKDLPEIERLIKNSQKVYDEYESIKKDARDQNEQNRLQELKD